MVDAIKEKRIFLNLMDMEKEKPDELRICEFKGQNFELVSGQLLSTRNELINKIKRSELIEPTLLLLLP